MLLLALLLQCIQCTLILSLYSNELTSLLSLICTWRFTLCRLAALSSRCSCCCATSSGAAVSNSLTICAMTRGIISAAAAAAAVSRSLIVAHRICRRMLLLFLLPPSQHSSACSSVERDFQSASRLILNALIFAHVVTHNACDILQERRCFVLCLCRKCCCALSLLAIELAQALFCGLLAHENKADATAPQAKPKKGSKNTDENKEIANCYL